MAFLFEKAAAIGRSVDMQRRKRPVASPGERAFGAMFPNRGTGWPGGWGQDRVEQVMHFRNWTFVAIDAIAGLLAQHLPNFAYVRPQNSKSRSTTYKSHNFPRQYNNFAFSGGSFVQGNAYRKKALSVVNSNEELEPLEANHMCRRLLENPNPMDTSFDLFYELDMFMELTGVGYLWAIPNAWGRPCELWVIPSHWVWPRSNGGSNSNYVNPALPNSDRLIDYYEIRPWGGLGGSGIMRLPADEVIMFPWKSPINKIDGYSKLTAAAQWIDTEESIGKARWSQMINQARPEFWVELGEGYEDPDDEVIARVEAKFMSKYSGEYNYGKPIFTPPGAKLTPLSFNPSEMAYFQSEEQIRDMILSVFRVPGAAVGLVKEMTYGSILATLSAMCAFCANPRLTMMGLRFSKFLAPHFVDDPDEQIKIWYDDCTPPDPAQVNADIAEDRANCAITPNEVRAIRGRQPYEHGGDDPLVSGPGGLVPLPLNTGSDMTELADLVPTLGKPSNEGQEGQQMPGMPGAEMPGMPGASAPEEGVEPGKVEDEYANDPDVIELDGGWDRTALDNAIGDTKDKGPKATGSSTRGASDLAAGQRKPNRDAKETGKSLSKVVEKITQVIGTESNDLPEDFFDDSFWEKDMKGPKQVLKTNDFFNNCERDEKGHCRPGPKNDIPVGRHAVAGRASVSANSRQRGGSSGPDMNPAHMQWFHDLHDKMTKKAKNILKHFVGEFKKEDDSLLDEILKAANYSKNLTQQLYEKLEAKYGRTSAISILAFALSFSWGTTNKEDSTLYVPGTTFGDIPSAALAEAYLQGKKGLDAITNEMRVVTKASDIGDNTERLTKEQMRAIGKNSAQFLEDKYVNYLLDNEDAIMTAMGGDAGESEDAGVDALIA